MNQTACHICPSPHFRGKLLDSMKQTQTFLDDFRRAQDPKKPRFEVYLVPGATPGNLQGSTPIAGRAIQGHSGENIIEPEDMTCRLTNDEEAPDLWHGTSRAKVERIAKTGIKPGAVNLAAGSIRSFPQEVLSWKMRWKTRSKHTNLMQKFISGSTRSKQGSKTMNFT